MVHPAEQFVELGRDQELPVSPDRRQKAVPLLREVKHLVAGGCDPAAAEEPGVGAHEPQPTGEQPVQQRVLGQVQRHLALQRHLSPVSTLTQ